MAWTRQMLGRRWALLWIAALWLTMAAPAAGQPATPPPVPAVMATPAKASASPSASAAPSAAAPPAPAPVDPRTIQVLALIGETLAVDIDPATLFAVDLTDEEAVQVELVRTQALLREVDAALAPAASQAPPRPGRPPPVASAAPIDPTRAGIEALDKGRWQARLDLDRARVEFYRLPKERRAELLAGHAARQEAAKPKESEEARRAREAEAERQRVLEESRLARSEAERLVGEETARLLGVEQAVLKVRDGFRKSREELALRRDTVFGWQRRVRDASSGSSEDADRTYDALRATLRTSRDELAVAFTDLDTQKSRVPELGPNPLTNVPVEVPTERAVELRSTVDGKLREARAEEAALRRDRVNTLMDEVTALNQERLSLLPRLSARKLSAITGFTEVGFEQAQSEGRHLLLILRDHKRIALDWFAAVRAREGIGLSAWRVIAVLVPWLLTVFLLSWWRRRAPGLIAMAELRIAEQDRADRRTVPSLSLRALEFVRGVQRPLEWLAFFGLSVWLLPADAKDLLEVQLLTLIIGWSLGGALVVNAINSVAAAADGLGFRQSDEAGALRLRSLQLVGRTVVILALILLVSARVVGEGTVYSWVLSTCWFAAIPLFLVLVRWWRSTVFERVDKIRKKSRLQAWILENRRGWKSFLAAMIAAVQLFLVGVYKTARNWVSDFDLARRALAYLYKRELDRLAGEHETTANIPLRASAFAALAPDRSSDVWVPGPTEELLPSLLAKVAEGHGGVVALVGGRGIGKSSLMRQLDAEKPPTAIVHCSSATTVADVAAALAPKPHGDGDEPVAPRLVLLSDVQTLIKPVLGGLARFDEILALARSRSDKALWVFSIDTTLWPFLSRARDGRPLFDEVTRLESWSDEHIGELLRRRSEAAGIEPLFDDLLDKLPTSADEIDRQEALAAKRDGYYRMIWDYASGNPALALEVWRASLVEEEDGTVKVRPLQSPDPSQLDALPNPALFILRAVLQMEPATVELVARATRLSEDQVQNAFRFGQAHGYLVQGSDGVRVAWPYLRAVLRLLERRHLLVNP